MNNPGSKKNIVPIIAAVFLVAVALIGNLGIIAASANDASCTCGTLTDVHNFSCPLYSSPSAQSDAPTFEATLQSVLNATNAPIDLTAGVENLEWAYSASGSETFKLNIFLDNLTKKTAVYIRIQCTKYFQYIVVGQFFS